MPDATASAGGPDRHPAAESEVLRALRTLAFGSVEITVHDSRIVQIERRERIRLDHPRPAR